MGDEMMRSAQLPLNQYPSTYAAVQRIVELEAEIAALKAKHVATPSSHPEIPDNSQPVARVAGYSGGRCVIEPLDGKSVFPAGTAMYVSGGSADAIDWESVAADQAMTIAMAKVDAEQDKKDAARFEIKETAEGYWYVRLDAQRFAQWPVGNKLTLPRCFDSGWWTQAEVDAINKQLGFDLDDAAMQQEQKP